jgi:ribose-phosphate pyrophosphokinase
LNLQLAGTELTTFADGETRAKIGADVRNAVVLIVQPTSPPVNDHLIGLGLLADAAKAAGAERILAVVPYFGYSRQEQRSSVGEPRSARLAINLLGLAGIDHLITLDLHAPALESAFPMPATILPADELFVPVIQEWDLPALTIVAPDAGGMKRAQRIAGRLGAELAVIAKTRSGPDVASVVRVLGDVRDRHCVIVDDMASTGRTLASAAEALSDCGASGVRAVFTHAVMAPGALERLLGAPLERLATSDSIPSPRHPEIQIVSTAQLLASAVRVLLGGDR